MAVNTTSALEPRKHELKDSRALVIRQAVGDDAYAVLDYIERISGESDFLSFGPGEFELTEPAEADFLRQYRG